MTLTQLSASGLEQGLLLKTAADASAALKVVYVASANVVRVFTFTSAQGWAQRGLDISVTFNNGDQFGTRAKANGDVEVYRNGSLLGTVSVTAWAPYSGGGYIGLWYSNASSAIVDDFGGGNVSASATATPTNTSTPTSANTSTITRTPTVTTSPAGTMTPSRTLTPANTLTPSLTPTLTHTPTFTPAFTSTPTSTPPPSGPVTINYVYDPLYRLKEANYSNGDQYHYTYDAVGNRTEQQTLIGSVPLTNNYVYDAANRLTSVDSVAYTWDNNGNLLNDGANTYAYDSANRLTALSNQQSASSYQYSGLGDRLAQSAAGGNTTNYTLDLNTGLTQVLNDGTNSYLYGVGRIAQVNTTTEYFLGDALNSTRQLTDASGQITLAQSYDPFGSVSFSAGNGQSVYGYTSEQSDPSGLVYLRARYYSPNAGRFTSKDLWAGSANQPLSLNQWNYTNGNPINYADPSGHCTGYKGLDPLINTAMSFTALYLLDADHWKLTGDSWRESWNTCVESFQKASVAYQRGDYSRAYLYAAGFAASSHQAAARIEQINREMDIAFCASASLGDRIVAGLDVGAWSIGVASFITPFAYEGWLATKGAINSTIVRPIWGAPNARNANINLDDFVSRVFNGDLKAYNEFVMRLKNGLPTETKAYARGSSITNYKWTSDRSFDGLGLGTSDLDLLLVGDDAMKIWKPSEFKIPGMYTTNLGNTTPEVAPTLNSLRMELQNLINRPLNIQAASQFYVDIRLFVQQTKYIQILP